MKFFEELSESIEQTIKTEIQNIKASKEIKNEEIELASKLDAIEEYTIDRFEEDIAVLENRNTGETKNIYKDEIPQECQEGDIIKSINGKYFIDKEETKIVENEIQEKYKDLWE